MSYRSYVTIEIHKGGSWHRYSDVDVYVGASWHEGRLLDWPVITERIPDEYHGIQDEQALTLRMSNADGHFSTWFTLDSTDDFRNKTVRMQFYEQGALKKTQIGRISNYTLSEVAEFNITLNDRSALQRMYPVKTISTSLFAAAPKVDLGQPVPVRFGALHFGRAFCVGEDASAEQYDYVISEGPLTTVGLVVYRATATVATAEYIFYTATDGANPYPGYSVLRFAKQQTDFSGNYYPISVFCRGVQINGSANDNFADNIQEFLTNATFGLGLKTDSTGFSTCAARLSTAVYRLAYSADEFRRAQDVINEMLWPCAGMLYLVDADSSGEGRYGLQVDYNRDPTTYVIGAGDNNRENVVEIGGLSATPLSEKTRSIRVDYYYVPYQSGFRRIAEATGLHGFGEDRKYESRAFAYSLTGTAVAAYYARRMSHRDRRLTVTCNRELLWANPYDIVSVQIPQLNASTNFQVAAITRRFGMCDLELELHSTAMWGAAVSQTLSCVTETDQQDPYQWQAPNSPTSFVVAGATYSYGGISWAAFAMVAAKPVDSSVTTAANFAQLEFGHKATASTSYQWSPGSTCATVGEYGIVIEGLRSSINYDFAARVKNMYGLVSPLATVTTRVS